jgi:hypothetical protein
MCSSRSLALEALERWRRGTEFADKIVADIFARTSLGSSDRAFVLELFYGVLRNLSLLVIDASTINDPANRVYGGLDPRPCDFSAARVSSMFLPRDTWR